ncbi:MAG: hypothetical protein HY044_02940 [Candidatus Woesebacteria bacterium]|nr:MAG: hypothetical protein HY044_02940 [Candidatus Woesebacteria bacterium]
MKIIGLTCHYTGNHDNSAALLIDGKIVFAESEERITRIKHDRQFPIKSIKHNLKYKKLKISDIDYFASASPPTNLGKLLSHYFKGFTYTSTLEFFRWTLGRSLQMISSNSQNKNSHIPNTYYETNLPKKKLVFISHYLAHAETAYVFSEMDKCLIVAWDGYGLNEDGSPLCGSIYLGQNGELTLLEEIPIYASLALYYGAVTIALGFKLNDGEGKTMGLAVYGKESPAVKEIRDIFPYFDGKKWIPRSNWLEVNSVSRTEFFKKTSTYKKIKKLIDMYGNQQIAFAAQKILEVEAEKFFRYLVKKYQEKNIALAGGIFLNVKFNMKLLENKIAKKLFIYPNPGDGGVAVGAALALYKKLGKKIPVVGMNNVYLGCEYNKNEIKKELKKFNKKIVFIDLADKLPKTIASHVANGKVVGWFQGRGEWGPRALGARSVLADPRFIETKDRINSKLKQRDWFMPFAPAILEEFSKKVLVHNFGTPYMTLTDDVKKNVAKKIPAAIHIDNTARSQIVNKKTNPLYWSVINEFRKLTGIPVILNTSFNKHGLPIVHSPKEAIEHLIWGCVDELAIGPFLVIKASKKK